MSNSFLRDRHNHRAIWGARDPESDILYLYGEYLGEADPVVHAAAIRDRGDWIPGLVVAAANGRNQVDGYNLFQPYRKLDLKLHFINSAEESGIVSVWQRMELRAPISASRNC